MGAGEEKRTYNLSSCYDNFIVIFKNNSMKILTWDQDRISKDV